ncbi:MAG TPA: hypothetical protein VLV78_02410 [Thermoanaerobaculia bacterium]|nr:hypothetical protein [Thermoanaerobaculia bacterium]
MSRTRERALFIAIVVLLVAVWVLKTALHLAGGAVRVILFVVIIFAAIVWASSKVGRAR